MPDDTTRRGAADGERINIHEDHELRDWARKFDASPDQILEAVRAVGERAADVEMHLKGSHSSSNADAEARAERNAGG